LQLDGSQFLAGRVPELQFAMWAEKLGEKIRKESKGPNAEYLDPSHAIYQLLANLGENQWASPEQMGDLARAFTGDTVDCEAVCDAGWQVGMLAKRAADGQDWYRLPPSERVPEVHSFLAVVERDNCVSVNLSLTPLPSLERLVQLGDMRLDPAGSPSLLMTPNLIRLGRAGNDVLASDEATWLFRHSPAFEQAHRICLDRRGKTIVHKGVLIARVSDLSLKLALEKSLGDRWRSLKNDYVVFPYDALNEVQRVVKKMEHVIKEVSNNEG
jgi:hypothetical protein